ncbi:unnamed protein product [[Candida] boidinii]|nr:unnamed protein product [[Candida] boidinii]
MAINRIIHTIIIITTTIATIITAIIKEVNQIQQHNHLQQQQQTSHLLSQLHSGLVGQQLNQQSLYNTGNSQQQIQIQGQNTSNSFLNGLGGAPNFPDLQRTLSLPTASIPAGTPTFGATNIPNSNSNISFSNSGTPQFPSSGLDAITNRIGGLSLNSISGSPMTPLSGPLTGPLNGPINGDLGLNNDGSINPPFYSNPIINNLSGSTLNLNTNEL